MAKIDSGEAWEQGFRAAVRAGKPGWTISQSRGQVQLAWKPVGGHQKRQTVALPVGWVKGETDKALLLVNRIAELVLSGQHDTLRSALAEARGSSKNMRVTTNWQEIANSLRDVLMNHRNEILASTWRDNYQPYVTEALRLIDAGQASDGHSLLKGTLAKWAGMAPSRAACCIALRNLTDHAISRFGAAKAWQITAVDIKELRGKPAKRRRKATLSDTELQFLIDGIASRNQRWANVIKVLALFGLRPIELQHLTPNSRDDGSHGVWCTYEKTCGGSQTTQRQLEPCWLQDTDGSPIRWNVVELMQAGLLEMPIGHDGEPRKLDGHYVEQFLKRQPEWIQLKKVCEDRSEWLRPYSFRDTYSLRCHRQKIELGAICAAMGHNIEAHGRAYRWESQETTAAAFASAFKD